MCILLVWCRELMYIKIVEENGTPPPFNVQLILFAYLTGFEIIKYFESEIYLRNM